MPNRIIKESIRTSKTVNCMTDFQFRLWVYLITYVDDYGRGSADPEILKGFVFPRRKRISETDIEKALADLAGMGCIHLYAVDGESYFCFPNWGDHQRIQTRKSKFPEPNANSQCFTVAHGGSPPESNPIQSESISESESKVSASRSRFAPPTIDEVKAYCQERHNSVDATRFVDFYASKGWMVGKSKMKDWQACVRTWEKDDAGKKTKVYTSADYDDDKDILGR